MIASKYFDQIAIALSAVCIVHCLAVPLVLALLPIAAISLGQGHFHGWLLWLVVPTSVLGLGLGYRIHKRSALLGLGGLGVTVIAVAATWGHGRWPEWLEIGLNIAGSLVLGYAHWQNFRAVRRLHHHRAGF